MRYLFPSAPRPMITSDSTPFLCLCGCGTSGDRPNLCSGFPSIGQGPKADHHVGAQPCAPGSHPVGRCLGVYYPERLGAKARSYRRRIGLRDPRSTLGGTCPLACDGLWIHGSFMLMTASTARVD